MMHQGRQLSDIEDTGGQPTVGVIKKRKRSVILLQVSEEGGKFL
jgi:hypothetical protein